MIRWGTPFDRRNRPAAGAHFPTGTLTRLMVHDETPLSLVERILQVKGFLKPREASKFLLAGGSALDLQECAKRINVKGEVRYLRLILTNAMYRFVLKPRWWGLVPLICKDRKVFDWLNAKESLPVWTKLQYEFGPLRECKKFTFMDYIGWIRPEFLTKGLSTPVPEVFAHVFEANKLAIIKQIGVVQFPAVPWTLLPGMRQIVTSAQMEKVGDELRIWSCLQSYVDPCADGRSALIYVDTGEGKTLVEIAADGRIMQHRTTGNAAPGNMNMTLVKEWITVNNLQAKAHYIGGW